MSRLTLPALFIATAAVLAGAFPAHAQPYAAIPIAGPPGSEPVVPTDINNRLQVVGYAGADDQAKPFIWDPVNGFRFLPLLRQGQHLAWIDDGGVVYGQREGDGPPRFTRVVGNAAFDFPALPNDTAESILRVTNNGIVLMAGARRWGFVGDTPFDLQALTGASISAVNEQGLLGGCKNGHAYLRMPDGREIQPWPTGHCVILIGPNGHFASGQFWTMNPKRVVNPAFYGTPGGQVFEIATYSPPFLQLTDINAAGALVGWQHSALGGDERAVLIDRSGVVFLDEAVLDSSWQGARAHAINDAGYIVATGSGAVLLAPTAPVAPGNIAAEVSGHLVQLRWNHTPGAAEYIVEAGSTPGASDLHRGSVGMQTSLTATVPNGRYYVRVRARTSAGSLSAPSEEVVIDVVASPAVPPAPAALTASVTFNTVVLTWTASTGATEYIVEAGSVPGSANLYSNSVGPQSQLTVAAPAGRYYVRVRARNPYGYSTPSEEVIVVVQ